MQTIRNLIVFATLLISAFSINVPVQTIFATPGTLYTLQNDTLQLGTIDPQTGKVTSFGPIYTNLFASEQLTALDYVNQLLYAIVLDITNTSSITLVALDLTTGSLQNQIVLPFDGSVFVGAGQGLDVDPRTGDVFVFGRESEDGPHTLLRVDPSTKTSQAIISFDGIDVLGGISAYDPHNKIYWVETSSNTSLLYYGIDVETGVLRWNLNDDNYDLETLAWDPATKLMYGFGLAVTSNETMYRTVVTLNSKTGELNEIASLEQYSIIYAAESTLDWYNRILYGILQPTGQDNAPFELVGVHMKSGKVVSNPQICTEDCPWSLNMFNKAWH